MVAPKPKDYDVIISPIITEKATRILEKFEVTVSQSNYCTYNDEELFYSYRRDKTDKRVLTLLWRKDV